MTDVRRARRAQLSGYEISPPGGRAARWLRGLARAAAAEAPGFDVELADRLARQESVDLHEVLELVDRGCPPPLAARIVTPLLHDERTPQW